MFKCIVSININIMNFEKYNNQGLSGLTNLGNTCFINSCVQVLSHTYELNDFLNLKMYKNKLNNKPDSVLLVEWDDLRQLIWSQNCVISPSKFINTIHKLAKIKGAILFTDYSQNDVSEFLIFIIDCFHTALSREVNMNIVGEPTNSTDQLAIKCFETIKNMYSKEYSEIWNMFYGIHVSQLTTMDTNECINKTPEPYFMIDLSIPLHKKSVDIFDCFNLYVEGEVLENVLNEKTNNRENMKKQILFWSFPNILVIDFKRFNARNQKNQMLITFPLENLNLSEYSIGYKKDSYIYDLYGICNHSGSVLGGHYTSFIKNANGKWYHFNDTHITEIQESQLITPKAYCLFYRKKTI
jgi:ubiquitin carboxyl-terminal hydrolase 2/21